ncbi:MAG: ABC transporter substrate-binding protein [Desulfocapsaceae bacterium]|nr:ABC transporter substrate-binding protein [Desulfocapsaceae bacterium]
MIAPLLTDMSFELRKFTNAAIVMIAFLTVIVALPAYATKGGPTDQLKPTLEKLINIVKDPNLAGDSKKKERRELIMTTVATRFDFSEMSKLVLGPTWEEITDQERQDFIAQMTKLLENNYIGQLENYSGNSVEYIGERVRNGRAQVSTLIENNGSDYPVHYIMAKEDGNWMVYDINIEGVSLIRNYRAEFKSILRQQNFDGLMQTLIAKNKSFSEKNN